MFEKPGQLNFSLQLSKKKINSSEEEFTGVLWGVVAQVKDYQLCWHLNKIMGFDLKRTEDLEIINRKKSRTSVFSFYRFEDDLDRRCVYVVSNKHLGEYLLPEMKQSDFIIMIKGEVSQKQEEELFEKIKSIPIIQLVVKLEYHELKSRQNLILE